MCYKCVISVLLVFCGNIWYIKLIFGLMGFRTNGPSDNKADSIIQANRLLYNGSRWNDVHT